jgi:pSer/pThr/pTyr-binding forkhead associated (FHA) protein
VKPRLQAVAGPLVNSIYVLNEAEIRIGRDASNSLAIRDLSLSRRHCVLRRQDDSYLIRDLESPNGTFVNGSAVSEARLKHGDQISLGDSVFVFLLNEDGPEASRATTQIRPQEVLYLQPDRVLKELPATSWLGRTLNALLKISRIVHSISDLDKLQEQILELIFEVVPAEQGAILLDGAGSEDFSSLFAHPGSKKDGTPLRVSRTITRQVMEQGLAILGADVPGSGGLSGVESLVTFQVRSLLCVPLTVFQKVIGCIYVDTTSPAVRFDQDHLELVASIAGISAVALENARRLHWLEQENLRLAAEINLQHNMVGESDRMKEVYRSLSRVPLPIPLSWCVARAGPERNWWRGPFIATARGRANRLSPLTARPFRKVCWRASSSATNGEPSPAPSVRKRAAWRWPTAGRLSGRNWRAGVAPASQAAAGSAGARVRTAGRRAPFPWTSA